MKVEHIYITQKNAGLKPTAASVKLELVTGNTPQLIKGKWGYSRPEDDYKLAAMLLLGLSSESSLEGAYRAYIAHLHTQKNTLKALSDITLGRWDRGLKLLLAYAQQSGQELPLVGKITVGWAKRYHLWLQTQTGGIRCFKSVSVGQASRFVLKLSNVLDWMIEDDLLNANPISRVRWPKSPDKKVQFLEPEHVYSLLNLNWEGNEGKALWWFLLMCCTGMDYPDAVAYAKNRSAFEVVGRAGRKIVGKRNKPPHSEYNLPLLDEVDMLFAKYPAGPGGAYINRYTDLIEEELDINWRITAKTARKTFGCLMLAAGHWIADVSLMLGHRNIATTEKYYVKVRGASIDRSMERVKVNISDLAGNQKDTKPLLP